MPESKINAIDAFAAIKQMQETTGWKLLMERYAIEGDYILSQLLSLDAEPGEKYTKRDLLAHQLHALGRLQACILECENDARNMRMERKDEI